MKKEIKKEIKKEFIKGIVSSWLGICLTSTIMFYTRVYEFWFFLLFSIAFAFVISKKFDDFLEDFKKMKEVKEI